MDSPGKFLQPGGVDGVGTAVMGAESYIAFTFVVGIGKVFDVADVQARQCGLVKVVVANTVEQLDEVVVFLTIDMLQFDGDQLRLA